MGDYPYSLLKRGHGIRTAVDVLFMEHGIHPKQIFETISNETAYRLSTVNMGLAIVPETTVILSHAVNTPLAIRIVTGGDLVGDRSGLSEERNVVGSSEEIYLSDAGKLCQLYEVL